MNKHLKQLIELSELDRAIGDFIPEEQRINGALNALTDEREKAKRRIEELENAIVESSYKVDKHETTLAEHVEKVTQHHKKSGDLKTEREVKALSIEEDIAKDRIAFFNDEIARLQNMQEEQRKQIAALKERIEQIDSETIQAQNDNAEAIVALNERRKTLEIEREKLVAEIPQKVFGFYGKIRRWAGNRTVAPVKKQACYSCFMKISDKVYSEVVASTEIITCPSCGCILYVSEAA